jgi:hypothetical protein
MGGIMASRSQRPSWPTPRAYLLIFSLLIIAGITRNAWAVVTCDTAAICPSDPCVINRPLRLEPSCDLDFTGRDVTIGPTGAFVLDDVLSGNFLRIEARNLSLQGSIQLTGPSEVDITVDAGFKTAGDPGVPHIDLRPSPTGYGTAVVQIVAGGNVSLGGSPVSAVAGAAAVSISANNIDVDSQVYVLGAPVVNADSLFLEANGSIHTSQLLSVQAGPHATAFITLSAASGDIVLGGPIRSQRFPNFIEMDAGGNVTLNAPIAAGTQLGQGALTVRAGGYIAANSKLSLRGFGKFGNEGSVFLSPGPNGNVSITKTIDVRGKGENFPGGIDVAACSLRVSGRLFATGYGISLGYRNTFDATGASLRSYQNSITCPCVDTNGDNVCDTGCSPAPIGLNLARVHVAPTITPFVSQPCS